MGSCWAYGVARRHLQGTDLHELRAGLERELVHEASFENTEACTRVHVGFLRTRDKQYDEFTERRDNESLEQGGVDPLRNDAQRLQMLPGLF